MREYEIVYIFRSNFTPEEIEAKLDRFHAILTRDDRGEVTAVEQWGKRQLAYPIRGQANGYYVVTQFSADPSVIAELERALKLDEELLRYLIVLSEGELPLPASMQDESEEERPRSRKKDDDEDDDEDEDEEDEDDDEDDEED